MSSTSVRDIFDQISHSVISFLENHSGVTNVEFTERQGVVEALLNAWEDEYSPYLLPHDFKSFLQISDGLLLEWKIKMNNSINPLGQMHINRLRDIKPFNITNFVLRKLGDDYDSDDEDLQNIKAFDLDKMVKNGRLALLYNNTTTKPQIYFQDLSGHWFFIANTFTDYFRLMVMHLGLPNWQYAFTEVGLDSTSLQWFRFLSPERLEIDIQSRKRQTKKIKKRSKKERVLIGPMRRRRNTSGFYTHLAEEKQRQREDSERRIRNVGKKSKRTKKKQ